MTVLLFVVKLHSFLFDFRELGMDVSMFERLDRPSVTAVLHVQYRMNGPIADLANKYTYNGSLQCANDVVKYSTIKLKEIAVNFNILIINYSQTKLICVP